MLRKLIGGEGIAVRLQFDRSFLVRFCTWAVPRLVVLPAQAPDGSDTKQELWNNGDVTPGLWVCRRGEGGCCPDDVQKLCQAPGSREESSGGDCL